MFEQFVKDAVSKVDAGRVPIFVLSGPDGHGGSLLAAHIRPVVRRLSARPVLVLPVPHLRELSIEDDCMVVAGLMAYRFLSDQACWVVEVSEPVGGNYVVRFRTRVPRPVVPESRSDQHDGKVV